MRGPRTVSYSRTSSFSAFSSIRRESARRTPFPPRGGSSSGPTPRAWDTVRRSRASCSTSSATRSIKRARTSSQTIRCTTRRERWRMWATTRTRRSQIPFRVSATDSRSPRLSEHSPTARCSLTIGSISSRAPSPSRSAACTTDGTDGAARIRCACIPSSWAKRRWCVATVSARSTGASARSPVSPASPAARRSTGCSAAGSRS